MIGIKGKRLAKSIKVYFEVLFYLALLITIGSLISSVFSIIKQFNSINMLKVIFFNIFTITIITMIYNIKKIISTFIEENPFSNNTVERMKKVSACSFFISLYIFVMNIIKYKMEALYFIHLNEYVISTRITPIIFFSIGLFFIILTKIFEYGIHLTRQ